MEVTEEKLIEYTSAIVSLYVNVDIIISYGMQYINLYLYCLCDN